MPARLLVAALLVASQAQARGPIVSGSGTTSPSGSGSSGSYAPSLSGTSIRNSNVTKSYLLYPGACLDRAGGTWVARTSLQADSLNTYAVGSLGGYGRADRSVSEKEFHVVDASTPAGQRPAIPTGSRAIWCGRYDPSWVVPVGYPDVTNQILHIDLESNRTPIAASTGTYAITMSLNVALERNYDFLYFIGGGDDNGDNLGDEDPLGNDRGAFDQVRTTGTFNASTLQATFTGNITGTTPGLTPFVNGAAAPTIVGASSGAPATVNLNFHMSTENRALYLLLVTDDHNSSEDGLWPQGQGIVIDDIVVNDGSSTRTLYAEQAQAGGTDTVGGDILVADPITATETDGVRISARVFPGKGELWAIQQGSSYTTSDVCQAQKNSATERFFLGVDSSTKNALPGQFNSIVSCTFPVPPGTAELRLVWGEFMNLPRTSGYVQFAEYRYFKGGAWSRWRDTAASNGRHAGGVESWGTHTDHLAEATQADSVQVRWNLECVPGESANGVDCDISTQYGVLYDDFLLEAVSGTPSPRVAIFAGAVAQTTFVDGTMTGANCAVAPCWPGIRGTALQTNPDPEIARSAVKDNFNSPIGDSIVVSIVTGLRPNGMGINWQFGFDKSVASGLTIARTNGAFNPAFDAPRMIYRLFDPATKGWSPWDSTRLDADAVSISAAGDTALAGCAFRVNWPPRDKSGFNLPGGFTINGQGAYDNLAFLPRGTRLQYYFKAVDINGGAAYQFSADDPAYEVSDLPLLPGGSLQAPDIFEFQVLPGAYPAGSGGSLLAGRTDTPVLNLDGAYTGWSYSQDPVTQALRGMGVRADRYRHLQGYVQGANAGGHELSGDRPLRLGNYFPNVEEYGIVDSLASWYRIVIQSSHSRTPTVFDEQDAQLASDWAKRDTGTNGGDRCIFLSGDDAFNSLTNVPVGMAGASQLALSTSIFGVANVVTLAPSAAKGSWAGAATQLHPTIDDRFAAPTAGPGLAAPGTFTYEVDGGCPGPNRFDPLTPTGGAFAAATYPVASGVTDVAAVAKASEFDASADLDQTKSLGYGYSIQFVRGTPGTIPRASLSYPRSGVENRMRILYKFLTGCRGARASGSLCWPCPTDPTMISNWAVAAGFNTGTYGPLMPIQDIAMATGVEIEEAPATSPRVNSLGQNRPNPFNPETTIPFSTAMQGRVSVRVYDVAGRLVRTLVDQVLPSGEHTARWNGEADRGSHVASGIYFYRIVFPSGEISGRKMMILR
ncbi:MAG TPA: FlgD immunoglobulin-like domain containing protein [Candidatus Eisenbacteria bacterium]|nr:FlgD immunoglobulin-like domain containing protein [Candidatus Eisenbacteria bacterium]